jgi:hyperosmotically inducible protein
MPSRLRFGLAAAVLAAACTQTDAGITTSVKSALAADETVQARRIDVDTREGVVTLRGEVRTAREETRALEIALGTGGVRDVVDELSVMPEREGAPTTGVEGIPPEPGAAGVGTDAGITANVKARLLADPDITGLTINVDTRNSVVTLTGTVNSQAQKAEAVRLAREVEGVINVNDQLTIEVRR